MKKYIYNYQTSVEFSTPVTRHFYKLRCVPRESSHQKTIRSGLYISGINKLSTGEDWSGNKIQYGCQMEEHRKFVYVSFGEVEVGSYHQPDATPSLLYLLPTTLTKATEEMFAIVGYISPNMSNIDKALYVCEAVNRHLVYTPGVTDNATSSEKVYMLGQGVCQDYAHLMVALCRMASIPARYVNGFLLGEGATHAWVEIYDGMGWIGVDPTHNRLIEYGYIKLADGRDVSDCAVNTGVFTGNALQTTDVKITVEEL